MYITKKIKVESTPLLDLLAREAGRCYSQTVSFIHKVHKRKNIWLTKSSVQKYLRLRDYQLHSHSVQAITDSYFDALKSFLQVRKSNSTAKPPQRTPKFYKVRWKSTAITFKDGTVRLSNGKGREPILLKSDAKPAYVEMYYKHGSYYFSLVYKVEVPPKQETGKVVAVDMGEIHPIVSHDGEQTLIYNGRKLRALKQYLNKVKSHFQSKMERCKYRSNRWYRLRCAKGKTLAKLNAQIKDAEHKITSRFISDCIRAKADTIVIGDLIGIRSRAKLSKKLNQKIHQWAFARLQSMICYKAELAGLKVEYVSEAYTSQTCPRCGARKKSLNRTYICSHCGFEYHRDGVGAMNIWNKVSGWLIHPVVGVMASPIGVKFHWHLCKSGL